MATTTIEGLAALDRKLRRLLPVVEEAAREAVRDEVADTAADMRRNAPRDTGELVEGIREHIDEDGLSGEAAATARHSGFVNDGTRKTPPQPFATGAAVRARKRFPKRLRTHLNEAIRKVAAG